MKTSRVMSALYALLAVLAVIGLIFTNLLPGQWWQYALSAVTLGVASAVSSDEV